MEYIVLSLGFFLIAAIIGLICIGKSKECMALPIVLAIGGLCTLIYGVFSIISEDHIILKETKKANVAIVKEIERVPVETPIPTSKNTMIYAGFTTVIREIREDEIFKCKSYNDERLAYVVRTTSDQGLGVACLTIEITR